MNEATGKTSSSLAITERKTHRPGGFVGIFSQLFDWNRRFCKKKLFSRKLLPPGRGKQASKKFGGDEKMSKTLHLIADENSGGFPNMKKDAKKHEMRTPGLVARLMGLDSMPNVHRDKHRKGLNSVCKEEKCGNGHDAYDREDLNLENVSTKIDSRPQKIRKTGQFERHAISKFGSESLQIKSILLKTRKHYNQSKLSSPVKSPRLSASRNSSKATRLIDVASRILEPGLQATNRARYALTYSSSVNYAPANDDFTDVCISLPQDVGISGSPIGASSCKNCGNLLDVDSVQNMAEYPSDYRSSSQNMVDTECERIQSRPCMFSSEQDASVAYERNRDYQSVATEKQEDVQAGSKSFLDGSLLSRGSHVEPRLRSRRCMPWKDASSSVPVRARMQKQNEICLGGDKIPSKARLNNLQGSKVSSPSTATRGTRDFVALNKHQTSRTHPKTSTRADGSRIDGERRYFDRPNDTPPQLDSPARKRRTASSNLQYEHGGTVNPMSMKQRNARCGVASRKDLEVKPSSVGRTCVKRRSASPAGKVSDNKSTDVISFTFNSPLAQRTSATTETKERRNRVARNPQQRKLVKINDDNTVKSSSQKQVPSPGDALGTLLQQKLKELTSEEENRSTNEGPQPKRSTAAILQELISALTAEQSLFPSGETSAPDFVNIQIEEKMGDSAGFSHGGDHLSPGSILEASFSNDCCISSSMDDSSGCGTQPISVDYSYQQQPTEFDDDALDCATSVNNWILGGQTVMSIFNYVCMISQSISLGVGGLTVSDICNARDVILNAELLFGSTIMSSSLGKENFIICQFVLDELETLTGPIWAYLRHVMGLDECKDETECRRFLFDCMVDCVDKIYCEYCNYGYKTGSLRVPSCMNTRLLIQEIEEKIKRCTSLVGLVPDQIIEREMNHGPGKWIDFETEVFESGADIDEDIFLCLVEELVIDLWD